MSAFQVDCKVSTLKYVQLVKCVIFFQLHVFQKLYSNFPIQFPSKWGINTKNDLFLPYQGSDRRFTRQVRNLQHKLIFQFSDVSFFWAAFVSLTDHAHKDRIYQCGLRPC